MADSFSISGSRITDTSAGPGEDVREEIRSHTSTDEEVSSILRSIGCYGGDPSIRRYDVAPTGRQRLNGEGRTAWSVRAIRHES
jgi:hypothetical protein